MVMLLSRVFLQSNLGRYVIRCSAWPVSQRVAARALALRSDQTSRVLILKNPLAIKQSLMVGE